MGWGMLIYCFFHSVPYTFGVLRKLGLLYAVSFMLRGKENRDIRQVGFSPCYLIRVVPVGRFVIHNSLCIIAVHGLFVCFDELMLPFLACSFAKSMLREKQEKLLAALAL